MSKHSYPEIVRYIAGLFADHGFGPSEETKNKFSFDSEEDFDKNLEAVKDIRMQGDELLCDELDVIEVIMDIEEEYDIEIPDEWIGRHQDNPTLGELADLVLALTK